MTFDEFRHKMDVHWPTLALPFMTERNPKMAVKAVAYASGYMQHGTLSVKQIDEAFIDKLWSFVEMKLIEMDEFERPPRTPLEVFVELDGGATW